MGGAALGKMWDTHPRLAAFLHSAACVLLAVFTVQFFLAHDWAGMAIVGIGFVIMAITLVVFTREATGQHWTRGEW
jgi:hypothetical protein